jgi:5'-nucleotidase
MSHSLSISFETAAHFTTHFARLLLAQDIPFDLDLLKLDVPAEATPKTPWRVTRVSRQRYFVPRASKDRVLGLPSPIDYEQDLCLDELEPNSDIYAFAIDKVVSVSPISLDLTARVELEQFERQLRKGQ